MSNVSGVSGPSGPYEPQDGIQPTIPLGIIDTLSTFTSEKVQALPQEEGISIEAYHRVIAEALQNVKNLEREFAAFIAQILQSLGNVTREEASSIIINAANVTTTNSYRSLNQNQNELLNPVVTAGETYSSLLETENEKIEAMNQAVIDFNNGAITEAEYNEIRDDYNNWVDNQPPYNDPNEGRSGVSSAYNAYVSAINLYNSSTGNINAYNNALQGINNIRIEEGLPPFPPIDPIPEPPSLIPLSTIPDPGAPPISVEPIPTHSIEDNKTDPLPVPAQLSLSNVFTAFNALFSSLSRDIGTIRENLSESFDDLEEILFDRETRSRKSLASLFINGAPGASTQLSTLIIGLDSKFLTSQLSEDVSASILRQVSEELPEEAVDRIKVFTLGLASVSSLSTALPAAGILAEVLGTIKPNSPLFNVALAFSFAGRTTDLLDAGIETRTFSSILEDMPGYGGLTQEQREQLNQGLSSVVNLTMIDMSLSFIATTLGIPGLVPNFFASLPSLSSYAGQITSGSVSDARDILYNPFSLAFIKQDLSDALLESKTALTEEQIQTLINQAVNQILLDGSAKTLEEMKEELKIQLGKTNLEQEAIDTLINRFDRSVRSEQELFFLDAPLRERSIDALLERAGDPPGLRESLADLSDIRTVRDFRDALFDVTGNLDQANQVAALFAPPHQLAKTDISSGKLSLEELLDSTKEVVIGKLTPLFGAQRAEQLMERLGTLITGFQERADRQIESLKDAFNEEGLETYVENLQEHTKDQVSLNVFFKRLLDPANSLLLSMQNGIMYSDNTNLPTSNLGMEKRTIDVPI